MDNKKTSEYLTDSTKKIMASICELQKINDRTVQELTKQQLESAGVFIKAGAKQLKILSTANTILAIVSSQTEIADNLGQLMVDNANRTMSVLQQAQKDLRELIEKNITDLMEETTVRQE